MDGVAVAGDAVGSGRNLLGARGGNASSVGATEVVAVDGVVPVGVDSGVVVVGTLETKC